MPPLESARVALIAELVPQNSRQQSRSRTRSLKARCEENLARTSRGLSLAEMASEEETKQRLLGTHSHRYDDEIRGLYSRLRKIKKERDWGIVYRTSGKYDNVERRIWGGKPMRSRKAVPNKEFQGRHEPGGFDVCGCSVSI
jgi:hypothetical protein